MVTYTRKQLGFKKNFSEIIKTRGNFFFSQALRGEKKSRIKVKNKFLIDSKKWSETIFQMKGWWTSNRKIYSYKLINNKFWLFHEEIPLIRAEKQSNRFKWSNNYEPCYVKSNLFLSHLPRLVLFISLPSTKTTKWKNSFPSSPCTQPLSSPLTFSIYPISGNQPFHSR